MKMETYELVALIGTLLLFVCVIPLVLITRLWMYYEGSTSRKVFWTVWILTPVLGIGFYWVAITEFQKKR